MSYSIQEYEIEDDSSDLPDWQLPVAFNHKRHTEKIIGGRPVTQTWRMKERMRTVSVALVLCLNVGVDPPDIIKTQPCARLECWIDPQTLPSQKALEAIGTNLQKQYERWQPRARYKQSLDPTVEEVKKLCTSLRKNAKDERVLFHYNGHGVPKPTANGEIWVFNRTYTQYIPLSIYDLQQWMGEPSIYVYDCSCAGLIVESFNQFAIQHEREHELAVANSKGQYQGPPLPSYKNCIQLAACGPQQILPMNPDLPADLFTSCLTTPIKVALQWFVLQNTCKLVPGITLELLEKIPGQLNDRRTMLGELNWLFTAITDTIAWNILPKDLFQKLFRQDLLVASLFRNFLLAERVMRSYNCNPISCPQLPSTCHHPMWNAWDLAVDLCLSQLPKILEEGAPFHHSSFFAEQLTAFQVWLTFCSENHGTPEQLPIVLQLQQWLDATGIKELTKKSPSSLYSSVRDYVQVLLSQVHRLRALELLGRFLDLGPWAVNLALSVGIFPYVLKLLQSSARELRPLLAFVWAKVIAVDNTCQADLVRDGGHKYFLNILADSYIPAEHRTMAAFVMSCIVHNYPGGQDAAMKGNLIAICLEQINDPNPLLRQWLAICLGRTWCSYEAARWCGVRDSAHEKLYALLLDNVPEVRAAAIYALGTFVHSSVERTDHANSIDHSVGITLVNSVLNDGSPIVRKELVVALQWLVLVFENQFVAVAYQFMEDEKVRDNIHSNITTLPVTPELSQMTNLRKVASRDRLKTLASPLSTGNATLSLELLCHVDGGRLMTPAGDRIRRVNSSTSLSSVNLSSCGGGSYANVYINIWRGLLTLGNDPYPEVANMANVTISAIKNKVHILHGSEVIKNEKSMNSSSYSEPSSPSGKPGFICGDSPPTIAVHSEDSPGSGMTRCPEGRQVFQQYQYSAQFIRTRKLFDKGPSTVSEDAEDQNKPRRPLVSTDFVNWCCRYFSQPVIKFPDDVDPDSSNQQERDWKFLRNAAVRKGVQEEKKRLGKGKLDEQVFINKNPTIPSVILFHPYESHLVVTDKDSYSVWDWEIGAMLSHNSNGNLPNTRITSIDFINAHDTALLMLGSDDGAVRIWRNYINDSKQTELITAFQVLSDMLPSTRGSGLVLQWEQDSSKLLASGDVRIIRLWDAEKEMKVQDIPTGADSCVTKLSTNKSLPSVLVAGCGDGTVRIYDCRLPPNDCRVTTLREHSGWVVNVHLYHHFEPSGKIVSGSVGGDIKFWDLRLTSSLKSIQSLQGMTAMSVHPEVDLIASGSVNQFISIYSMMGEAVNIIKYHDGFMGHRIGPISCLAFHPYKVNLGAGSTDSFISVYTVDKKH